MKISPNLSLFGEYIPSWTPRPTPFKLESHYIEDEYCSEGDLYVEEDEEWFEGEASSDLYGEQVEDNNPGFISESEYSSESDASSYDEASFRFSGWHSGHLSWEQCPPNPWIIEYKFNF